MSLNKHPRRAVISKKIQANTSLAVLKHLAVLFQPGLDPATFGKRAGKILRQLVPCDVVSFAVFDPATHQLDIDFDPYLKGLDVGLDGFGRHMKSYPCFSFDPTVNGGKPILRSDFLSDEEFYNSPIYREGFAIPGISDHAAVWLPSNDDKVVFIGLELCGGAKFEEKARTVMNILQPHLANAYNLAQAMVQIEAATADVQVFQRAGLTPRQAEVLAFLSLGKSNPEIALILGLSLVTVKSYVSAIFDRLGVCNRHAAIVRAYHLARASDMPSPSAQRASTTVA